VVDGKNEQRQETKLLNEQRQRRCMKKTKAKRPLKINSPWLWLQGAHGRRFNVRVLMRRRLAVDVHVDIVRIMPIPGGCSWSFCHSIQLCDVRVQFSEYSVTPPQLLRKQSFCENESNRISVNYDYQQQGHSDWCICCDKLQI